MTIDVLRNHLKERLSFVRDNMSSDEDHVKDEIENCLVEIEEIVDQL